MNRDPDDLGRKADRYSGDPHREGRGPLWPLVIIVVSSAVTTLVLLSYALRALWGMLT